MKKTSNTLTIGMLSSNGSPSSRWKNHYKASAERLSTEYPLWQQQEYTQDAGKVVLTYEHLRPLAIAAARWAGLGYRARAARCSGWSWFIIPPLGTYEPHKTLQLT